MEPSRHMDAMEPRSSEAERSLDALFRCVDRVEIVVREEMEILKKGGKIDFEALNQRKSHVLLELLRFSKSFKAQNAIQSAPRLKALQKLLGENADLLARRLRATEEITGLILGHIRDSESDGTYSIRSREARRR